MQSIYAITLEQLRDQIELSRLQSIGNQIDVEEIFRKKFFYLLLKKQSLCNQYFLIMRTQFVR